jgi:phosphate transport system substrate-binding protein
MMTGTAYARDQVQVAGSSTVLPYANIVAEQFGKRFSGRTPIIESGGSSAGLKLFCQGIGPTTIDIANSSRRIRQNEINACGSRGVTRILEVKFGYDGIVFATDVAGPQWALTPKDVYLALNDRSTAKTWKDVNASLPAWDIVAYIPGEKHGTREVFEDKVLLVGCKEVGDFDKFKTEGMDKKAASKACIRVRKDGGTVDIDGDYTETLGRLQSNKTGVGVFGLSFYENNTDKLRVATMSGVSPSVETISTGEYPVSRPLFFYVKLDHLGIIPGLREYVEFFTSERMIGEDGPLAEYGLVPMPEEEFEQLQATIRKEVR